RLVLEADKLTVPAAFAGILGGLVRAAGVQEADEWWRPARIAADRDQGSLTIVESHPFRGEERTETIALADVDGLRVRTRHDPPPARARAAPPSPDHPR